ncbi:MAG: hypothetical protein H6672_05050 [Anaerolineaceae bacterium]|nr:hypothetical protein [Anaerolineaceae bacterium]
MRRWQQISRIVYLLLGTLALTAPALAQDNSAADAGQPFPMLFVLMMLGLLAIIAVGGMAMIRMLGDD